MLKTVSSITNAIGALNYVGTWNASTNSPALASGVGTKGDYYVVSVAGSTNLDGETLWGVGDWAVYNGAAWQKVEGGNTINATTVSASTSVTTPVIQATSSAGGTLKNNGGTAQLQWGSGGGSNLSLEVATNINPANAAVAISPTGTGTVTISPAGALTVNPTAASTINNTSIGITTPLAGKFTDLTSTGNTILGDASTDTLNVGNGGLVKDASGNLGLGVTPFGWNGSATGSMDLIGGGSIYHNSTSNDARWGCNLYITGGANTYKATNFASTLSQSDGSFFFASAPSGTAGTTATLTTKMTLDASGNLTISGATATKASGTTWANPSDIRLKDNVTDYSKGLAELMQVNVKEWTYNGKGGTTEGMKGLGVIADEIMEVLPDTVDNYQAKLNADDEADTDIKKFDATEITWLMLNAIKEQQALITSLTARLDILESK